MNKTLKQYMVQGVGKGSKVSLHNKSCTQNIALWSKAQYALRNVESRCAVREQPDSEACSLTGAHFTQQGFGNTFKVSRNLIDNFRFASKPDLFVSNLVWGDSEIFRNKSCKRCVLYQGCIPL